jgi:uncharacterized membrane protein YqjE
MRLAKVELSEKLSDVGRHAMMIGVAAAFGLAAVVTIAAAITLLLIEVGVVAWLAAAITAAVMGLTAYLLAQVGDFRAAQEIDRSRRNDSFPQGDDPVAQERNEMNASHSETGDIQREIERTRVEMSETIGEIQDRLRPDHLLQQAKDGMKEAATGKVKNIMNSAGEKAYVATQRARRSRQPPRVVRQGTSHPHRDSRSASSRGGCCAAAAPDLLRRV